MGRLGEIIDIALKQNHTEAIKTEFTLTREYCIEKNFNMSDTEMALIEGMGLGEWFTRWENDELMKKFKDFQIIPTLDAEAFWENGERGFYVLKKDGTAVPAQDYNCFIDALMDSVFFGVKKGERN